MNPRRAVWVALAVAAVLLDVGRGTALACATCGCGDPTLSVLGVEQPFGGRFRIGLEGKYRNETVGIAGFNRLVLHEARLEAKLAWAPTDRLLLLAVLPYLRRDVTYVNGGGNTLWGLGDAELYGKWFFFRDREFAPQHLLAWTLSARFPTAGTDNDATGAPLPAELQAGAGAVAIGTGLSYAFFADPWSFYASALFAYTVPSDQPYQPGPVLRGTLGVQWQATGAVALRAVADSRADLLAAEEGGEKEPDSGGFILFAGMDLVLSPVTDLLVVLTVRAPVANALEGHHDEGWNGSLGVVYDL